MKFVLRTGLKDSTEFAIAMGDIKTQGVCQGNGAAPAGWTVDSVAIIQAHKQKGHGVHLRYLISNKTIHLAGTLNICDAGGRALDH
jgi:hypothetical protein